MKYNLIAACVMFTFVGLNAAQLAVTANPVFLIPLGLCFLSGCIFVGGVLAATREETVEASESEDETA